METLVADASGDLVKLGAAVIGTLVTVVTVLGSIIVFFHKRNSDQEKSKSSFFESELAISKQRHDNCEKQHEETKRSLGDIKVDMAKMEARLEERDKLSQSIEKLSDTVLGEVRKRNESSS